MSEPIPMDPARAQRVHELGRAYDAVQTAANRLELAGMDDAASQVRRIRSDVYRIAMTLSVDLDAGQHPALGARVTNAAEPPLLPSRSPRRRPTPEVALTG